MNFRQLAARVSGIVGAAPLLAIAALGGCERSEAAPAVTSRPAFAVIAPQLEDTSYEREYVGEVHAARYAEVRSRLKGVIESVAVDEGQRVKAGQLLFSINARELQQEASKARAATKSAEAELRLSQLERDNTKMLFEKKVVSEAEMALAESKTDAVAARVAESKASQTRIDVDLGYAKVRAGFDGLVNRIPRRVGSMVGEDELLTTLTDTSDMLVYFRVSEREYLEHVGREPGDRAREVSLKLADGSLYPAPGVIDAVESEVNRETGNLAFRAKFPNPQGTLKHGSSGKIVIRTPLPGALLVPQRSTFEVQGRLFVYAVDASSTTRAREIVAKARVGDAFVVASGLTTQDRFILEGIQKIKEGMRVDVVPPG